MYTFPGTDYVERGTVLCTRPCLRLRGTGPCDSFEIHYDNGIMLQIIDLLRETDSETEGYLYDMNDFCRQLLSNYAQKLYAEVSTAYIERRYDDFRARSRRTPSHCSAISTACSPYVPNGLFKSG